MTAIKSASMVEDIISVLWKKTEEEFGKLFSKAKNMATVSGTDLVIPCRTSRQKQEDALSKLTLLMITTGFRSSFLF